MGIKRDDPLLIVVLFLILSIIIISCLDFVRFYIINHQTSFSLLISATSALAIILYTKKVSESNKIQKQVLKEKKKTSTKLI